MASPRRRCYSSDKKKLQSRSFPLSDRNKKPIKAGFRKNQSPKKRKSPKKKVYSRKRHIIAIYNPNKTISYIRK